MGLPAPRPRPCLRHPTQTPTCSAARPPTIAQAALRSTGTELMQAQADMLEVSECGCPVVAHCCSLGKLPQRGLGGPSGSPSCQASDRPWTEAEVINSQGACAEPQVVPAGWNKWVALRVLLESMELPAAALAAVGDGSNDLEMVTHAGVGFAMGNAVPEVKAAASMVVACNDTGGVAEAIERLGLL